MNFLIDNARKFAEIAHYGQKRKYNGKDYITHPVAVAEHLLGHNAPDHVVAAAYLHDVLEDTPVTKEELLLKFGEDTTTLVEWVTNIKEPELPRAQRKANQNARLAGAPSWAQAIKLIDRLANIREFLDDLHMGRLNKKEVKFATLYSHETFLLLDVLLYPPLLGFKFEKDMLHFLTHTLLHESLKYEQKLLDSKASSE
jgi:(p)ppGpp synthase/HD superfamily hydrolase